MHVHLLSHTKNYKMSFQHYLLLVFDAAGVAAFPLAGVFAPPLGLRLAGVRATFLGLSSSEIKDFVEGIGRGKKSLHTSLHKYNA